MRIALWWMVLLVTSGVVGAQSLPREGVSNAWLLWEYEVAAQPGVSFEATLTSAIGGQSVRRVQPMVVLTQEECQLVAMFERELWTLDTLCAALCLPAGPTTVTVSATKGPARSGPSNEAHRVVQQSCGPPLAPPPPPSPAQPPPPKLPDWAIGVGATGISGAIVPNAGTPPTLPELVNRHCVSWRITSSCLCGFPPRPCVIVDYWEPTSIIEIVKRPGTSALPILGPLLKAGLQALGVSLFGGGGAGQSAGAGNTNLFYSEAHVWSFPQLLSGPCTACLPINALPRLQYASEADAHAWRTSTAPLGVLAAALRPVGTWGPLFPRVGFVIHHSPPIAAALQGVRALHIASQPVTPPPVPETHVAISPALGLSQCIQMASPKQTPCLPVGLPAVPPVPWDTGATSVNGSYIFLMWSRRICCVPMPGTCGITLPGIGLHGANLCPL